jgi:hypothetical protein
MVHAAGVQQERSVRSVGQVNNGVPRVIQVFFYLQVEWQTYEGIRVKQSANATRWGMPLDRMPLARASSDTVRPIGRI